MIPYILTVRLLEVNMSIEKEKWLSVFAVWLRRFEASCDLLGIVPTVSSSYILALYRGKYHPDEAATLLLSWGSAI